MLKILESIKAEAEALLAAGVADAQKLIEKAEEAIGIHKTATANAAVPTEPALSATPEGVLVEGAGVVSQAHIDAVKAAGTPVSSGAAAAPAETDGAPAA